MRRLSWMLICVLLLASIAGLPPRAEGQQAREIRVRMQFSGPRSLDPVYNTRAADYFTYSNIFNNLVRWKPGGTELEADLAERWEISADGRIYTFYLRRGIQFHKNYGEVTAEDAKFSFDRFSDPKVATPNAGDWKNVERIEVVDRYTVRITLRERAFTFITNQITSRPAAILSKRAVEEKGDRFARDPIGTGPFVFESWSAADEITLVANPRYFRGAPRLAKVTFVPILEEAVAVAALERGQIHVMWTRGSPDAIEVLRRNRDIRTQVVARVASVRALGFNPSYAPLRDVRVRHALAHAVNKNDIAIATGALLAPAEHPLPRTPWLFEAQQRGAFPIYRYDPQRARQLLAEAGAPNLRLVLSYPLRSPDGTMTQVLAEQWRRVGVDTVLEGIEQRAWDTRRSQGQYQVTTIGIGRGPDPDELARDLFHSSNFPPGENVGYYDKADGLIDAGARERNPDLRQRIYIAFLKQAMTDLPVLPLAYDAYLAAWRAPVSSMAHGINNDFAADTIVLGGP